MGANRTQAQELVRAIRAVRRAGFEPGEVVIASTGDIRLRARAESREDAHDDVLKEIEGWERGRR